MLFKLKSTYKPSGDQPQAIEKLVAGIQKGLHKQTLLGVTGSGKTFTMANVIEKIQMPTLVIAHNKTLAAQLCNEFREFFPENAVEYFVSYYDYYQPEAYMPGSDTYIEKEAQINEEIDRLRHACTQALLTRRDVIIVASVSCIYGLGSPEEYEKIALHFTRGQKINREEMLKQLIEMQFTRTNSAVTRGTFRLRGQVFEVMPVNEEIIYRLEISNKIELIELIDSVSRKVKRQVEGIWLFPAKHYVTDEVSRERAFKTIREELQERLKFFEKHGKVLEHERLKRRVKYDLEMIKNIGYCNGIENYSRHFDGRNSGDPPFTLLDYFKHTNYEKYENTKIGDNDIHRSGLSGNPDCFLTIIDESHVTVPQIRGMFAGDKSRKDTLIEHGFRLPSARDNRPLNYREFEARMDQVIYTSATPDEYELGESQQIAEQIVRPTGLVDPEVIVRPITGHKSTKSQIEDLTKIEIKKLRNKEISQFPNFPVSNLSQIEDLILRINQRIAQNERILVTTLTKKMAEDLYEYLLEKKYKVKYIHSDVQTMERIEIITDLRRGKIDVLVGVNLLREGLDMPEVSLVAILDADKEGFLRSATSLIQTIGRAARNVNGQVILYADNITGSIKKALDETNRRRKIQLAYNKKHGITPKTIEKNIKNILEEFGISTKTQKTQKHRKHNSEKVAELDLMGDKRPIEEIIKDKEKQMSVAAKALEFELATILRDEIKLLRGRKKSGGELSGIERKYFD